MSNNLYLTATEGVELEERTNVPFILGSNCPKCGCKTEEDFSQENHFYYPVTGHPAKAHFGCECGHHWEILVILRLTVELAP